MVSSSRAEDKLPVAGRHPRFGLFSPLAVSLLLTSVLNRTGAWKWSNKRLDVHGGIAMREEVSRPAFLHAYNSGVGL